MDGTLGLHVAFGNYEPGDLNRWHPRHWMLVLAPIGGHEGTYFHVKGSHEGIKFREEGTGDWNEAITYTQLVEENMPTGDNGIGPTLTVAHIPWFEKERAIESIRSVKAQRCQEFVVEVLRKLETEKLLDAGDFVTDVARCVDPSIYGDVKDDSPGEAFVHDLYLYALTEQLGELKKKKCCY